MKYRPTFGTLYELPATEITQLKRATVTELLGWNAPINVPAVEIVLTSGRSIYLSLNLRGGEELLGQLCEMTKLQCK